MANIQRLNYQIAPASKTNHLTDAKYIQGGYLSVDTLTELRDLPIVTYNADGTLKKDGIVVEGSMAYVREINDIYIYQEDPRGSGVWKWKPFTGAQISWTYSTEPGNPVNVDVGGVKAGTTFTKATLDDLFEFIFHKEYDPTFRSLTANVAAKTYEYGTKLEIKTLTPKYEAGTSPLNQLTITDSLGNELFDDEPVTSETAITLKNKVDLSGTTNYTISAELVDKAGNKATKELKFMFTKYNYYGISKSDTAFPSNMTQYTSESITITSQEGTYIYIYAPSPRSKMQQYELGDWNDMDTTYMGQIMFDLDSGETVQYYAYRSAKLRAASNKYRLI